MKKIIENAKKATEAWKDFVKAGDNRQRIDKYFHLRPTNSGITVITTLNNYEMRGVSVPNEKKLIAMLEEIDKNYETLVSLNDKKRKEIMEDCLKFRKRGKAKGDKLEEKIQAIMINTMSEDKNLAEKLGTENCIRFIASELICEQGKHRIDIVGFDGQDIYFFELKKHRTKEAVKQMKNYMEYYSKMMKVRF